MMLGKIMKLTPRSPNSPLLPNLPISNLRSLCPPRLLLSISKQPSEDLAAGALGNSVKKLNSALEPLVMRLVVLDVLDNLCRHLLLISRSHGFRDNNERLGDLAGPVIGDRNNSYVVDGGVSKQVSLQLSRRNLMSLRGQSG